MKKVFARIGMYLAVSDEEYERMKEKYSHEDNLSIEDCKRFHESGWLSALTDYHTDSYIPECIFEEPDLYVQDFLRWDDIYAAAEGKGCLDWQLKVKDNARAYVTDYAMRKYGIDIESAESPEDAIEDFLKKHIECDRFNENGQMLIAI